MHALSMVLLFAALLIVPGCSKSDGPDGAQPGKEATKDTATEKNMENPLIGEFKTPFGVPPFDQIKPAHYLEAMREGIKRQKEEIKAIVNNPAPPDFANTVEALENSGHLAKRVESIFDMIRGVQITDELLEVAKKLAPLIAANNDDIRLNGKLFQRLRAVHEQAGQLPLNAEQKALLEKYYKEFVRGGANLEFADQERFRRINQRLEELKLKFSSNILGEDNRFQLLIEKKEDLAGLPQRVIDAAAETAAQKGLEGRWMFTLHKPSLIPFLQFSDKRELREKMLTGYITRGDHGDQYDNKATLKEILSLREKRAHLLGYKNHAEYVLEERMAKTPEAVYDLLNKLWKPALVMAKKEAADLQELIKKEGHSFDLKPWDWWYYTEKLRKARFDIDDNELRPYFKLDNVREGAFYLANRLFGLKFERRTGVPVYNEEVEVYEVMNEDGSHLGVLYMDLFPRSDKRGGAWMNNIREQSMKNGKRIAPIVTNNGNFTRPSGDSPSLLSFDEVETLYHEFGHALHGLLSQCTYEKTAGTAVPMDFVELPSQIMENWITEPEMLKVYARHYKTNEVIPAELVEKIKKAELFNQGFVKVEFLAAAFLDMDWYTLENPGAVDVTEFETKALNKIGLIPEIVVRYRSTYFNHVFSSIYPAGYYSYIWAEVLDADAFQAFKETALFDRNTADAFRQNVLEKGGSLDPMELYKKFRGREPVITPLLKRSGFVD